MYLSLQHYYMVLCIGIGSSRFHKEKIAGCQLADRLLQTETEREGTQAALEMLLL